LAVLLIDTYSLFFRAYHALPPMNTLSGEPTSALYGLSSLLLKLLREERPEGLAFALDRAEPTFRHTAYPGYKATRDAAPRELVRQFARLDQLLAALGAPRFAVPGFEADDVLATLAHELERDGRDVIVASGDRDLLQLTAPRVDVLFLGQRGKPARRYDVEAVRQRFGIDPERLPLYVALLGDVSDNIPKVKGIGPSGAQKLASRFTSSDELLANLDTLDNPRLSALLSTHADQLRESEHLARLRRDVPLPDAPRYAALSAEAIVATQQLFEELEFKSLIPRLATFVQPR
jgi:DNA polymerase I